MQKRQTKLEDVLARNEGVGQDDKAQAAEQDGAHPKERPKPAPPVMVSFLQSAPRPVAFSLEAPPLAVVPAAVLLRTPEASQDEDMYVTASSAITNAASA